MDKIHIETPSGFVCEIDEAAIGDYELLRACREVKTDASAVVDVVSMLLGDEEPRLMDHLRGEDGRVTVEAVNAEIMEILEALKSKKK